MIYEKISGFSDEISEKIDIQFETLKKLNISYFEPRGVDGKNISALSEDEIILLKNKMEMNNIKVSSIGSPIGKIKLEEDFSEHFELFKRVVETAKKLDSKYIRIFSFYHDGGDMWTMEERDEILSRLKKMIAYAKKNGVVLLHENEKDIYGDNAERCYDLMKELYCDNFKAVFDPANFVQCKQDTEEAYKLMEPYIEYMHIKDADKDGNVVPAGMGVGKVAEILKNLKEKNYNGFLSLEPHLGSFTGLTDLETDDKMTKLEKSSEQKFIIAYDSLIKILKNLEE